MPPCKPPRVEIDPWDVLIPQGEQYAQQYKEAGPGEHDISTDVLNAFYKGAHAALKLNKTNPKGV